MKRRSIKKTVAYNRVETLAELKERNARFEYEVICDDYKPHIANTDARAELVHLGVALRNAAVALAIVVAFILTPRAIDYWKLYAYSQSPLWSQMYAREIEQLENRTETNIPELARNASAGIGITLLLYALHRAVNRQRVRSPRRRGGSSPVSGDRRQSRPSSRLSDSRQPAATATTPEISPPSAGVEAT